MDPAPSGWVISLSLRRIIPAREVEPVLCDPILATQAVDVPVANHGIEITVEGGDGSIFPPGEAVEAIDEEVTTYHTNHIAP